MCSATEEAGAQVSLVLGRPQPAIGKVSNAMASVRFEKATLVYPGADTPAVDRLDLDIEDGEFMVFVGPSGCGKSTSLRMLAGLEEIDEGAIYVGDREVTRVPPKDRDIAMVFQNYALYPHMTVSDNMAFSLKMAKTAKPERTSRVSDAAKLLDIMELLARKPKALSGGQRQRVAMGRAIVRKPQVFCMDEPLSNLDAKLRVATRAQIVQLQSRLGVTTVYVTHDQVEAMTMGHRVAVMNAGLLQQVDTPLRLYKHPVNAFVAGFMGSPAMNLLKARLSSDGVQVGSGTIPITPATRERITDAVTVGIRPEDWRIAAPQESAVDVTVVLTEDLGSDAYMYGSIPGTDGEDVNVVVKLERQYRFDRGQTVRLTAAPESLHIFDAADGRRLSE
jgi:multiple sugar transport system ATP-binding protein